MKKLLTYFFIAFIGLAVLSTSVGITISKMVCAKGCIATVAIGDMTDCCRDEKGKTENLEKDCCDISGTNIKVDTYTVSQKAETPVVKEITLLSAIVSVQNVTLYSSITVAPEIPDVPPKPSGKSLLVLISRFTI